MEILYQTNIITTQPWAIWVLAIGIVVAVVSAMLIVCHLDGSIGNSGTQALCIALFIVSLVGVLFGAIEKANPSYDTGRDRYEVVFNEPVEIEDIYDKYEFIERQGEIWLLEDKKE